MPVLIITRGLPGSGKTTKAREWVAEDPVRRARVNRDDLRAMLHNSTFIGQTAAGEGTERAIVAARDAAVAALLGRSVHVIVDDTNLSARTARDLRRLAVLAGADFLTWDLTNVPLDECLRRNAARTDKEPVPEDVIRNMHRRYVAGSGYPLPLPDEAVGALDVELYESPRDAPLAVIVDVDGTLALMVSRGPYDEDRVHEDRPNLPVIAVVEALHAVGYRIVFCSGRTDTCREATEKWLRAHVNFTGPDKSLELHMRRASDNRRDSVTKLEIFNEKIRDRYHVIGVLDDRRQVVDMWQSLDLTVFQVAEGNF